MTNPAPRRTIHPFADQGKFTAVHNSVFDVIMPNLPPNAFKVLCLIIRKTVGWQKDSDQLSYSQIAKGTGIKSPSTLSSAIETLEKHKYILSISSSKWEATAYRLNTALEIEVPTTEIEVDEPTTEIVVASKTVAASTPKIVVVPTTEIVDTKERYKEKKEREGDVSTPAHSAIELYTELTGRKPIKFAADRIAKEVSDLTRWRDTVKDWLSSGYKPNNVVGMLDWYHGKGRHKGSNAPVNRVPSDLPLVTAADSASKRVATPEDRRRIMEETRAKAQAGK